MPSDAKWVQMAKKVAAGTALDDEVCSFKLSFAVLEKLHVDFVATAYENAAKSYLAVAKTVKTETRQRMKNIYILLRSARCCQLWPLIGNGRRFQRLLPRGSCCPITLPGAASGAR